MRYPDYAPEASLDDVIKIPVCRKYLPDTKKILGKGISPTNNEIKDIVKVIKPLENRGILLKGTTRKITTQETR